MTAVDQAPVTGPTSITLLENTSYTFQTSDFPYSDPNNTTSTALKAVIFETLPGAGTITDNGLAVTAGEAVAASDIAQGKVVYTPAANGSGASYASFSFAVENSGGTANGGQDTSAAATATINVEQVIVKNNYDKSGRLVSTETIYPDGSYDVRFYTGGTFKGVAYASVDRTYTAANVLTGAIYYDASGNVKATETFVANGGNTITLGGVLYEQTTVNTDGSYDVRFYTGGTFKGVAYASVDRTYTAANVLTGAIYYDASGNVNATEAFAANGGNTIMLGGVLYEQTTVNTDGSYDVRFYTGGTFKGVAYASVDRTYTAANVLTGAIYYDASGNVKATETFVANGGNTITLGGVLYEQTTVNTDGSYDVRFYTGGTFNGVAYASVDRTYTAANVLTGAIYYDASGNVKATEAFAANGGNTIMLGGVLYEQTTVNTDGSYDVRFYTGGTFKGVAYASVDRTYTAAHVLTGAIYYDASGNVKATETFVANGGNTITLGGVLYEQTTVNTDGSYDVRFYTGGTFKGVAYASVDRTYTAANVLTGAIYYDASGNVKATEAFAANGGNTIMLGGVLYEQTTVNTDGSYDVRFYTGGTFKGVAYASVDRTYTAANVLTGAIYYDGSGKVVATQTFAANGAALDAADPSDVIVVAFDDNLTEGTNAEVQFVDDVANDDSADPSGRILSSTGALMLGVDTASAPRNIEINTMIGPVPTRDTLAQALLVGGIVLPAAVVTANGKSASKQSNARRRSSLSTFDLLADRFESVDPEPMPFDLPSAMHSGDDAVDWEVLT